MLGEFLEVSGCGMHVGKFTWLLNEGANGLGTDSMRGRLACCSRPCL